MCLETAILQIKIWSKNCKIDDFGMSSVKRIKLNTLESLVERKLL